MALDTAKLTTDLRAAIQTAHEVAAKSDDGGTCNLDSLALDIPGARLTVIEKCVRDAGGSGVHRSSYWRNFVISIGVGGQANSRTRAVEAARNVLRDRGWTASVNYVTD